MGYSMFFLALICLLNSLMIASTQDNNNLETYIVQVELPTSLASRSRRDDLESWYKTFLPTTSSSSTDEQPRIIYSYHNVMKGFAAKLSPQHVKAMQEKPGFISATPQEILPLHTTHTPQFLGLSQNTGVWSNTNYGKGVIIGVLDTGVNPSHPSFSDQGMSPPPAKWKGVCQFSPKVCNNKVIGARYFSVGNGTPFDENGHGTHTASTAAGNFVSGANVFGMANGTASGMAPLAHVAIYKVCGNEGCPDSDILAGIDKAIDDGCDIISMSLGGAARPFWNDNTAIGVYKAVENGILVSASAGNSGPTPGTVSNSAPWFLTVGASSLNRQIRAYATLGNNLQFSGESIRQYPEFSKAPLPLVYPGMNSQNPYAPYCTPEGLRSIDIRGKVVVCDAGVIAGVAKGQAVRDLGGAAVIITNQQSQGYSVSAEISVLPTVQLSYADGQRVKAYIPSTTRPTATISFGGTKLEDNTAPMMAYFSSRGPNTVSRGILKPDITGPGFNILAAWPVSVEGNTNTRSTFNIISGTSMSCPHLSGIAALLRKAHPDWSPAAIRSAIMTTADQTNRAGNPIPDETGNPANMFATGAGHVNVPKATDPGLVYDIQPADYVPYLCGLGYTDQQVSRTVGRNIRCSTIPSIPEAALNYPSFSILLGSTSQTYTRTVTNVGEAGSTYTLTISALPGVAVTVSPKTLSFAASNEKKTYEVAFTKLSSAQRNTFVQGFLTLTSAKRTVRSPIVVTFQ